MKKTAIYDSHINLNAKMVEYANFLMPISYSNLVSEHFAVRNEFGIFDVSHMGEILISGKDAFLFLNKLVSNTIILEDNKVNYALLLNDDGNIIDDLFIYPFSNQEFLLVVNASNKDKDFKVINEFYNNNSFDVKISDLSDSYSQIAIQGPKSVLHINDILDNDVLDIPYMRYKNINYNGHELLISRSGYTGEDGFEIYGDNVIIPILFDKAINNGAIPCGLGCRDTLRFEASLPLYGNEMDETVNPFEANLGYAVKLDKDIFVGKSALLNKRENLSRKIVGLDIIGRGIPRHGYEVYSNDKVIGYITTGYLSPVLNKSIAFAMLDIDYTKLGTTCYIKIRDNFVEAIVRNRKFISKNNK